MGYLQPIVKRSPGVERTKPMTGMCHRACQVSLGELLLLVNFAVLFGQFGEAIQGESEPATLIFSLSQNAGRPDADRADLHAIVHDFEIFGNCTLDRFPSHVALQNYCFFERYSAYAGLMQKGQKPRAAVFCDHRHVLRPQCRSQRG